MPPRLPCWWLRAPEEEGRGGLSQNSDDGDADRTEETADAWGYCGIRGRQRAWPMAARETKARQDDERYGVSFERKPCRAFTVKCKMPGALLPRTRLLGSAAVKVVPPLRAPQQDGLAARTGGQSPAITHPPTSSGGRRPLYMRWPLPTPHPHPETAPRITIFILRLRPTPTVRLTSPKNV